MTNENKYYGVQWRGNQRATVVSEYAGVQWRGMRIVKVYGQNPLPTVTWGRTYYDENNVERRLWSISFWPRLKDWLGLGVSFIAVYNVKVVEDA